MELPQERNFEERPMSRRTLQGAIECRGLNFTYPNQQNQALRGINLNIRPGEKVGIIGRSGSGKSTLARLLMNFYTPSEGQILLDNLDLRQLDVADLRHQIGYVAHDLPLLSGSLRDNLTLEGYWQPGKAWEASKIDPCGTYFSTLDPLGEDCEYLSAAPLQEQITGRVGEALAFDSPAAAQAFPERSRR